MISKRSLSKIVLASASPRRHELLKDHFRIIGFPRSINENVRRSESPKRYVRRMALEKWQASQRAWKRSQHFPLIAADTTVVCRGKILGKAASKKEASKILKALSGREHWVHTSIAIGFSSEARPRVLRTVSTRIRFRKITGCELNRYLDSSEWKGKAGAYGIQGSASSFVDAIWGSLTSVVGLPVNESLQGLAQIIAHPPA